MRVITRIATETCPTRTGEPSSLIPGASERDRLVETHVDLASSLARGFIGRGEELDDLRQVALLALVKATLNFDPPLGYRFSTFAMPTILGALERHLRDHAWAIRPPRALQERYLDVNAALDALTGDLHRAPETSAIAEYVGWSEQEIRDALAERVHRNPENWGSADDGDRREFGAIEYDHERVEDRYIVNKWLAEIGARERAIIEMRFLDGLGQAAIGKRVGVSQMHVCRLLKRSLETMRNAAALEDLAP